MKNLFSILFCLFLLVCFLGCETSPLEVDATDSAGDVLYRTPGPKPDCKIVKCGPPPKPFLGG